MCMLCLPLCPVCDQPPLFPGDVNVARFNEKPLLITCSHPCHSEEELEKEHQKELTAEPVVFS